MFSTLGALERVWILKRVKTPKLLASFPLLSGGTLHRAMNTLHEAGAVRTYRSPVRGRVGQPPRFWTLTARGKALLQVLLPYRDLWERLDNRDVRDITAGIEVLDKLEALRINFFPLADGIDARANYFRGARGRVI